MKARNIFLILVFASMMIIPLATNVSHASYQTGFDSSAPLSPNPQAFTWTSSNLELLTGHVAQDPYAYSLPNDYQIIMSPSGSSYQLSGTLSLNVNASSTTIQITWYQLLLYSSGTIPTNDTFQLFVDNSLYYTIPINQMNQTNWIQIGGSIFSNIGSTYTIQWIVNTYPSTATYSFTIAMDNVYITGANVINPSQSNLYLVDQTSGSWFSIDNYSGSSVTVYYNNGQTKTYNNIYAPDMNVYLNNASLISVNVANKYYRTIIPNDYGANYVFLNDPSNVVAYNIVLTDISGQFPIGSKIEVLYGNQIITSGYIDASDSFETYLTPGVYTLEIFGTSGAVYIDPLQLGIVATTISVDIYNMKLSNPTGYSSTVSYSAGWNTTGTGIVVAYDDTSNLTSSIQISLIQNNQTFQGVIYSVNIQGPLGYIQTVIPADSMYVNINQSSTLLVQITAYSQQGSQIYGPLPLISYGQYQLPTQFFFPNILGINLLLPAQMSMTYIIALIILIALAGLFGAVAAPLGTVVVTIVAVLFAYIGALPVSSVIMVTIVLVSILGLIAWRERNTP